MVLIGMNFLKNSPIKSKILFVLLFLLIVIVGEIIILVRQGIDVFNWETYRNEEFGFEVKHPKGWVVIVKEPNEEAGIKEEISISSDVLSFDIAILSNNERLARLYNNLLEAPIKEVFVPDESYSASEIVYSIQEHLNISNFTAVIYYIDYSLLSRFRRIHSPIIGEAMLKKRETTFHFLLIAEQEALLEKNKDIFKQILSTFRFTG